MKRTLWLCRPNLFAIVQIHNHQYKIMENDIILTQRISSAKINDEIRLKKILMVGGENFTMIGRPFLNQNHNLNNNNNEIIIRCVVEEHKKCRNKVSLFRTPGRRMGRWVDGAHSATVLRVLEININHNNNNLMNNNNNNEKVFDVEGFKVLGEYNKYYNDPELLKLYSNNNNNNNNNNKVNQLVEKNTIELNKFMNPVFSYNDGYDVFYKKDWKSVEESEAINVASSNGPQ